MEHLGHIRVALLAEGVDRNFQPPALRAAPCVALLAEGVDRNIYTPGEKTGMVVALLAEGVDRNSYDGISFATINGRPPRGGRG